MEYWVERWDWECSTLFGIELDELKLALHRWPSVEREVEPRMKLATLGALRELLYGASSLPKSEIREVIGISYDQAESLIETLQSVRAHGVKTALGDAAGGDSP